MGGSLEVESEPGCGSTFTCTLVFKKHLEHIAIVTEEVDCKAIVMLNFDVLRKSITSFVPIDWTEVACSQDAIAKIQQWKDNQIFVITDSSTPLDFLTPEMTNIRAIIIGHPSEITLPTYKNIKAEFVAHPVFRSKLLHAFHKAFNGHTKLEQKGSPRPSLPPSNHVILVAEDNALNRVMATKQLEKLGYKSVCAVNGLEILKLLAESHSKYSLILMDCQVRIY